MADTQSLSDQQDSRPSSLSESTSDAASDQPSISSTSTSPPPPPHAIDHWNRHVKFQDFVAGLQDAAKALFPNEKTSRYSCVSVLVLSWQDEDPRLPVSLEIAELVRVFREVYHYDVDEWKIPSQSSHLALNRKIMAFVDPAPNDREHLKIVYYAGHGRLTKTRLLEWTSWQDRSSSHNQSRNQPVQWSGIQVLLEQAENDVLILLDCCAAGTANAGGGSGVTELIAACPYNGIANGVGPYSFTNALVTELLELSHKPSFSVGELYSGILLRAQGHIPERGRDRPAPMHIQLTRQSKLPRSIHLSVRSKTESDPAAVEQQSGAPEDTPDNPLEDVSQQRPDTIVNTTTESRALSPTGLPMPLTDKLVPRLLFAVRLEESFQPNDLTTEVLTEWLRMIPLVGVQEVKIEAGFNSFSSVVIVSVPIAMTAYVPTHPAVVCLGPVMSRNLFFQLEQQEPVSAGVLTKDVTCIKAPTAHRRNSMGSNVANTRKKRTRVLISSWAKLRLGRSPSRPAKRAFVAAAQPGTRHGGIEPILKKRVGDLASIDSPSRVSGFQDTLSERNFDAITHSAVKPASAPVFHATAHPTADSIMQETLSDASNKSPKLHSLTSASLTRLAETQTRPQTLLEALGSEIARNIHSRTNQDLMYDLEAQRTTPNRGILRFGSSKRSQSIRSVSSRALDVTMNSTVSSISSKASHILEIPSSNREAFAFQSTIPIMAVPITAAQEAYMFAVTGGNARSSIAEVSWTWYFSFLERRIHEAWMPCFREVLNNVDLLSYQPNESDISVAMRFLTIIFRTLQQRRDFTLTDVVDELYKLGVTKEVDQDRALATQLVFAAIGWITLLYTPNVRVGNMLLELSKPGNFLPADGVPIVEAYNPNPTSLGSFGRRNQTIKTYQQKVQCRDQPFVDLLRNFGSIIPQPKGGGNEMPHAAHANGHDRWIEATNISFATLSRLNNIEIEWVECLSEHMEFDIRRKKLRLFRYPSICVVMTQNKECGPLNQLFCDSLAEWSQSERNYADEFLKEVLSSYRLIFGMDKDSCKAFKRTEIMRLRGQPGPTDPLIYALCGQLWDSPEVMRIFDQCSIEEPVPHYKSDSFPFLGYRFLKLQNCTQLKGPEGFSVLWHDKRDTMRWWTFWAVILMGIAAVVLGFLQICLQVLQLYYTVRPAG